MEVWCYVNCRVNVFLLAENYKFMYIHCLLWRVAMVILHFRRSILGRYSKCTNNDSRYIVNRSLSFMGGSNGPLLLHGASGQASY